MEKKKKERDKRKRTIKRRTPSKKYLLPFNKATRSTEEQGAKEGELRGRDYVEIGTTKTLKCGLLAKAKEGEGRKGGAPWDKKSRGRTTYIDAYLWDTGSVW